MFKIGFIIKLVALIAIVSGGLFVYGQVDTGMNKAPSDSPEGQYTIEVVPGETLDSLAQKMANDNVINSSFWFMLKSKAFTVEPLQVGAYVLDLPANPASIIEQVNKETTRLYADAEKYRRPVVENVLIREGSNIDTIIGILADNGISTEPELQVFAQNPDNFASSKYEFLPKPLDCTYGNLNNCAKYYLEGYLYPDTYDFFADATPAEVFDTMLQNFNTKVWSKIKDDIGDEDFHKTIILASVMEKETGRTKGITSDTLDEVNKERQIMAGVFNNRTAIGMTWGSDVTLEYGHNRKLCQQTFTVPNCIYINDPLTKTKYNTYVNTGYPIGPVSNPQYYNIFAALNPIQEDENYLYFVSDVIGRKYFSRNEAEFQQSIVDISRINRELEAQN